MSSANNDWIKLAPRMANVKASPTLRLNALAKQMQGEGIDVVNLTAGETDFSTSEEVQKAALEAMHSGQTRYTPAHGVKEMRPALQKWFSERWKLNYAPEQLTISCGIKQGLFNLMMVLIGEGDEVIFASPYWVSYPAMVDLAGGKSVVIETEPEDGFRLSPEKVKAALTKRTKLLVLNTPNNPTGAMADPEDLRAIAKILEGTDVMVVSDEIYAELSYEGEFVSFASLSDDAFKRTITMNGLSKSHAMTGWRVGFVGGDAKIITAMGVIQGQSVSNLPGFVQYGALEALKMPRAEMEKMRLSLEERRNLAIKILQKIEGIVLEIPRGAFYCFPDLSAFFGTKSPGGIAVDNSSSLSEYLLSEEKVATVPGIAFGEDRCIRLSFATDPETLTKGLERIVSALQKLTR